MIPVVAVQNMLQSMLSRLMLYKSYIAEAYVTGIVGSGVSSSYRWGWLKLVAEIKHCGYEYCSSSCCYFESQIEIVSKSAGLARYEGSFRQSASCLNLL
jgi:hypothetical protein